MTTSDSGAGSEAPPAFSWLSPVFFDEMDPNGNLHNSRFAVHVERAQSALFERLGKGWTRFADRDPDLRYAVRELHMEFLAPLESPGALRVELTARSLGRTSATYGFRCTDTGDERVFARGHRVIVKIDEAGQPVPWSNWYRETFEELAAGRMPASQVPDSRKDSHV
jgi:acyl-CoA thioester hydrolase